jgi:hypothetical protein
MKDPGGKFYRKCTREKPCDHCRAKMLLAECYVILKHNECVIAPFSNYDLINRLAKIVGREPIEPPAL